MHRLAIVIGAAVAAASGNFTMSSGHLNVAGGNLGVNTNSAAAPAEKLYVKNGNIFIDSTTESHFGIKMNTNGLRLGDPDLGPIGPLFMWGRIVASPPLYKAQLRMIYDDAEVAEKTILNIESTGTTAFARDTAGSHVEGFFNGESTPLFRVNSSPTLTYEAGPGGAAATDCGLRRTAVGEWTMLHPTDETLNSFKVGATTVTGEFTQVAVLFAALGTPADGIWRYCSDCTKATPCAGAGTGALAKRLNGAWDCD